ncbi:MAG TPA: hypothetical protein VFO40_01505, partial [Chthoniobacterales bacterium]|nr:hypothetical protein [Chthoniobacterales bacterium]
DGSTTFNLPDARGRTLVGAGQGTGLANRVLAASGGEENHQLTITELAQHTHVQNAHNHVQDAHLHTVGTILSLGNQTAAGGGSQAIGSTGNANTTSVAATNQAATAVNQNTGGNTAHNNMPPFLAVNYIIKN